MEWGEEAGEEWSDDEIEGDETNRLVGLVEEKKWEEIIDSAQLILTLDEKECFSIQDISLTKNLCSLKTN